MKMLVTVVALLLLVAGCTEADPWQAEAAAAIGDELTGWLAEPLDQAADTVDDPNFDPVMSALDSAFDDMTMPVGVFRIIPGSHSSSSFGGGYADVSLPLVVVPIETRPMFCMIFALSSTGELVAEPAPGDPVDRCTDTDRVELIRP